MTSALRERLRDWAMRDLLRGVFRTNPPMASGVTALVLVGGALPVVLTLATGAVIGALPEAARGGPIGLVADGDRITLDVDARRLDVELDPDQMETRRRSYKPPSRPYAGAALEKYARLVSSASEGAVTL